jgi:pimeloyl-ACP methyl ester carboxylesterase
MRPMLIEIDGTTLEAVHTPSPPGAPTLVFLHGALGSVAGWREFPYALAAATGLGWMAYSRAGHGRSGPPAAPRDTIYLDREAIDVLPAVLERLGINRPILFGHDDGATIALIHAAGAETPVEGVILEAPLVFVEAGTLAAIRSSAPPADLGEFHRRPEPVFEAWRSIRLAPDFADWTIAHRLPAIIAPVLAIWGHDDAYGRRNHIDMISAASGGRVETLTLAGIAHAPHAEAPAAVIAAAAAFIASL